MYIRECGSTLYVGLAHAVSPTSTKFRLTFLLTRLQEALYEHLYRASNLKSIPSLFWPLFHSGSLFLAPVKNRRFLRFIHNTTNNNNYHFHHHQLHQAGFLQLY